MDWNTVCNVTNNRPGPAPGSKPAANTAGIVARPAMIATNVSANGITSALLSKFCSLGKYEPYATMMDIPRDKEKNI